jgi:carboxylesterase type B
MIASPLAKGLFHRAIVQSGGYGAIPMDSARNSLPDGGHRWSAPEIVSHLFVV